MVEKHNINYTTTYNEMFFQISHLKEQKTKKIEHRKVFGIFAHFDCTTQLFRSFMFALKMLKTCKPFTLLAGENNNNTQNEMKTMNKNRLNVMLLWKMWA